MLFTKQAEQSRAGIAAVKHGAHVDWNAHGDQRTEAIDARLIGGRIKCVNKPRFCIAFSVVDMNDSVYIQEYARCFTPARSTWSI
jgi:hypothetical protein